jgi:hypothetical protein
MLYNTTFISAINQCQDQCNHKNAVGNYDNICGNEQQSQHPKTGSATIMSHSEGIKPVIVTVFNCLLQLDFLNLVLVLIIYWGAIYLAFPDSPTPTVQSIT